MKLGYIGLGVMGMPVARHLAGAGHDVHVHDLDRDAVARAAETPGIVPADGVAAVVEQADVVFTCLPSPAAVEAVYAAIDRPGLVCCDNSTVGPTLARSLDARLAARGMAYVECPMLGGETEAEAGTLFLLLSGAAEAVERVVPLATLAARDHRVVGGPGTASLFKTVQNGLGHVQAVGIAEALALVAKAGGDLDAFIDVVGAGEGMACTPLFRARAPMMRDSSAPTFGALHIAAKDAGLAAALADELGIDLPLFQRARTVYEAAIAGVDGPRDMSALARAVERETGVRIARDDG